MARAPPKPSVVTGYPAMTAAPEHHQPYTSSNYADGNSSASAPAYPYPAPPYYAAPPPLAGGPQAYYGPTSYNSHQRFLRGLVIGFILVLVLVGAVTFVTWLVLRPRLPEFSVTSAAVSILNVSSSSQLISSDFNVTFSVTNPNNKMSVYYDRVRATIFYGPDSLMATSLPPVYQGKRNSTFLTARFFEVAQYIDADIARGILDERKNGAVDFQVGVLAGLRFDSGAWRTRKYWMRVYCDGVKISFRNGTASAGLMEGSPKQCRVNL